MRASEVAGRSIVISALIAALLPRPSLATVIIDNGLGPPNPGNVISTFVPESVYVQSNTTAELVAGGQVGDQVGERFESFDTSTILMSGGFVFDDIFAHDSSHVLMTGGSTTSGLLAEDSATVLLAAGIVGTHLELLNFSFATVTGGLIGGCIIAHGSSMVEVTGGSIDCIVADSDPDSFDPAVLITLVGTGFMVNGVPVPFGPITPEYGDEGTISGTLVSGETIDAIFRRNSSLTEIVLAPEPSTAGLVGLGLIGIGMLRRSNRVS